MAMSPQRLKELERAEAKLRALEAGGVDNWDGYDFALEGWAKENQTEEKLEEILVEIEVELLMCPEQPAGVGCGYNATDEARDKAMVILKKGVEEICNKIKKGGIK